MGLRPISPPHFWGFLCFLRTQLCLPILPPAPQRLQPGCVTLGPCDARNKPSTPAMLLAWVGQAALRAWPGGAGSLGFIGGVSTSTLTRRSGPRAQSPSLPSFQDCLQQFPPTDTPPSHSAASLGPEQQPPAPCSQHVPGRTAAVTRPRAWLPALSTERLPLGQALGRPERGCRTKRGSRRDGKPVFEAGVSYRAISAWDPWLPA